MKKVLGIDVGGTKIASAMFDSSLTLKDLEVTTTSQTDLMGQLISLIESRVGFDAIGLAMPGPVLPDGTVSRLPNVPHFEKTNLKKILEERFEMPVKVLNDAKAFAYAEATIGQGQKNNVVAGVILGTGIGAGVVIDKKIYSGKDGVAGEFEHVTLLDGTLFRVHRHQAGKFKDAKAASKFLKTIFDMVVLSFNPDVIILGGGWDNLEGMEEVANRLTMNVGDYDNHTPVKISTLKYPSLQGAALLALND